MSIYNRGDKIVLVADYGANPFDYTRFNLELKDRIEHIKINKIIQQDDVGSITKAEHIVNKLIKKERLENYEIVMVMTGTGYINARRRIRYEKK
jgi:hypothetical protein